MTFLKRMNKEINIIMKSSGQLLTKPEKNNDGESWKGKNGMELN